MFIDATGFYIGRARQPGLSEEKCLRIIEEDGNTGSASSALIYAKNESIFEKDDLIVLSVFGGVTQLELV